MAKSLKLGKVPKTWQKFVYFTLPNQLSLWLKFLFFQGWKVEEWIESKRRNNVTTITESVSRPPVTGLCSDNMLIYNQKWKGALNYRWLDWNELLLNNTVSQVLPFWLLFVDRFNPSTVFCWNRSNNVWNWHYLLCRTFISLYQISDLFIDMNR